ncbi:DUF485 domain-containing protein [Aneurinibacillus tyrosinisolvens]|uniref:DUF485 domain-containing protein n=1 Tax=Aneurinibacillus tyrosinisolvens TaxID=1443435 RepID=UPI00063EF6E3|nr:DUF485 domain-containing protein [Aneurinibacillus tyrosinisolvens]
MSNLAKSNTTKSGRTRSTGIDYTAIAQSEKFKSLLAAKKSFIVPMSIFFFIFYFTLPVMTSYSKVLNTPAIGAITWAWIFAFAQFIMTWTLCTIYSRKASSFDKLAEEIVEENAKGGNQS